MRSWTSSTIRSGSGSIWERVLREARASAGTLLIPADSSGAGDLATIAGADLLTEVPEIADWLVGLDGRLVVGNYLYADGGTHVRLSAATDLLAQRLCSVRDDTALAFLATPIDVFVVSGDAVEQSALAYRDRSRTAKVVGRPLRWVTRGGSASPCLSTRRGPGDRRRTRAGAGTELRAGQTDSAVASGGRAS
jgi:hypothetical protein